MRSMRIWWSPAAAMSSIFQKDPNLSWSLAGRCIYCANSATVFGSAYGHSLFSLLNNL